LKRIYLLSFLVGAILLTHFQALVSLVPSRSPNMGPFGIKRRAAQKAPDDYKDWRHSCSLFLLTTPDGANLPALVSEHDFPLLIRLNRDTFDFSQTKPHGEDIRFATANAVSLPYQIEEWDAAKGTASVWVRIPEIKGNARQEIRLYWGNTGAESESSGAAVFSASNGYLSVLHMNDPVQDDVGVIHAVNMGTTDTAGIVGRSRHFAGNQGVAGGEGIVGYPAGSSPHSSEVWVRAKKPNVTILGWGNEGGGRGGKVRMQFRSPPHLHIDSDFADVNGSGILPVAEWIHIVHTYENGVGRIYINGRLDGTAKTTLDIKRPARMWIGGWYGNFDFVGDIDEVRISNVARSADWVRLGYENQKPMQTLVGPPVQSGGDFGVSPAQLTLAEGKSVTLAAKAGGAQKVYWTLDRTGQETVVAVDRLRFTLDAGRVTGDQSLILRFKAAYPNGIKTQAIPVTIKESIPDPIFTLQAPTQWDGRRSIEVVPKFANLAEMQAQGAGKISYLWSVSGIAVIKEEAGGKLLLHLAQNSGRMTVTLSVNNGGVPVVQTTTLQVHEPQKDVWVERKQIASDEKPEDNQFYARNDNNEGILHYNGNLVNEQYGDKKTASVESVFLNLYAGDHLIRTVRCKLAPDKSYMLSAKLRPGLIRYKVEFGARSGSQETILHTVSNLVCGDAYLINGQSNAEATAWGEGDFPYTNTWIRSFGSAESSPEGARLRLWGDAGGRASGGKLQIGYWGMELARRLVEDERIPICILNGAVGGTRIDQHQRNSQAPEDLNTIYGRLLFRVRQAHLTHGIKGILWHQGENDQGADSPTGGYGWETYRQYFVEMSAAWKQDFPNIQRYYLFQIWPKSCAMGIDGSDNRLREVQRELPALYSHMSIMSTLGVKPPGGCHYPPAGYAEIARLISALVERDSYGRSFPQSVAAPNLRLAAYANARRDEITLEFDQPMVWNDALASQFYLDGTQGKAVSGSAEGNVIHLKLIAPLTAQRITYLDSKAWSQDNLLYGKNDIAALTFYEVPIASLRPSSKRTNSALLRTAH
jgi:hypothetical protein